jgi:Tol biopolymer transport system component/DNA-binding winged helix-turn-helix (wHTH) protein
VKNGENRAATAPGTMESIPAPGRVHFGEFTLDRERQGLFRGDDRVHLTARPLETLLFLAAHRGRTVTRKEILDAVWKDVFVTDDVLTHAVRDIRHALDDDRANPRFVLTVPREGYRFIAEPGPEVAASADVLPGPTHPVPLPPAWPRPLAWVGLGAAIAVALIVWLAGRHAGRSGAPAREPAVVQLTSGGPGAVKPAYSPDGKLLLYASSAENPAGVLDLFVMTSEGESPLRVTRGAESSGDRPVFTPDGQHVVFSRYRRSGPGRPLDLWIVPALGGEPRLFLSDASGAGFSPDGKWIAYTHHRGGMHPLWVSAAERLEDHREAAARGYDPRWSPDGRWIAYATVDPNEGGADVNLVTSSLDERRQLTFDHALSYGLAWTPDGRAVIAASRRSGPTLLWRFPIDGSAPSALTSGVGDYTSPDVAPGGRTLVFCNGGNVMDLVSTGLAEGAGERVLSEFEVHHSARLSPSGRRVASVIERSGKRALVVTDVETGARREVGSGYPSYPAWVGEELLAYLSHRAGSPATEVRVVDLATGVDRVRTTFPAAASWLDVDPLSGRLALVIVDESGGSRVVIRDRGAAGQDRVVARGLRYEGLRWSPGDGALLWSGPPLGSDADSAGIWRSVPGSGRVERILEDGALPVPRGGGERILFLRAGASAGVWQLDTATGSTARLREGGRLGSFDVAGDRLLLTRAGPGRSQIYAMSLE